MSPIRKIISSRIPWLALSALVLLALVGMRYLLAFDASAKAESFPTPEVDSTTTGKPVVSLPALELPNGFVDFTRGIPRLALIDTRIPKRSTVKIRTYTVKKGDSAWLIARKFDLQPESILWGNPDLSAQAGSLSIGLTLNILPVDGVLHTVREGDTLEGIAARHHAKVEAILGFTGNDLDLVPPYELKAGQQLVVPGGSNPIAWQDPGPAVVPGLGRKSPGLYSGNLVNIGTGYFIWPIAPPIVLTQDFWGGHPAIDLDTYYRQPIFASDSGTVIYSDWSSNGYGNLVIIDHGNGLWTYYAHNEANLVSVGQGVVQGQQIAESGSTGNSTGYHLDFRIRVDGGSFVNPMGYLPPP